MAVENNGDLSLKPWVEDWRKHWSEPLSWPRKAKPGRWDVQAHIVKRTFVQANPDCSALVLVDVDKEAYDMNIEDFAGFDDISRKGLLKRVYDKVLPNTIRLVEFFRYNHMPIVYLQWHWHKNQYPPLEPMKDEIVVSKWKTGAFNASALDSVLRDKKVSTVFFAGADTSFCVESTVRGAVDCGYNSIVVEDACFGALRQLHDSTILTLGWHLAYFTTTKQVIDCYPWDRLTGISHPLYGT